MACDRQGLPAGGLGDLARGALAAVELATGYDHVGTGFGEALRHGATDAAAAAGDNGDLSGQVESFRR